MKSPIQMLPAPVRRLIRPPTTVSVVRLHGVIGAGGRFSRGLSDESVGPILDRAFEAKPAAVALSINSPGGSPVQSSLIARRIRRLAAKHDIPVIAYLEDVAASGGYWLACAADEIHADPASLVGSIGVIHASFGLHELIARHGVERRVHATGANKAFLDPFQPEDPAHAERLEAMLGELQEIFIAHVRDRRGDRLREDAAGTGDEMGAQTAAEPLFDGRVWTAGKAQALGLIDGLTNMRDDMEARFGAEVRLKPYGRRRGLFSRMGSRMTARTLTAGAAAGAIQGALEAAEERALWARFGL